MTTVEPERRHAPGPSAPAAPPAAQPPDAPRTRPAWQTRLVRTLIGTDALVALLAAQAAVLVHGPDLGHLLTGLLVPLVWVPACASTRAYEPRFLGTGAQEFRRVFDAGVRLLALTAVICYALDLSLARVFVLVGIPLTVLFSLLARYALRQRLVRARSAGRNVHRVVVVGRERSCAELIRQLHRSPQAGFLVVGACTDSAQHDTIEGVPIVGTSSDVVEALEATAGDTVAVGPWANLTQDDLRHLSWQLEGRGVDLVVAPSVTNVAGPRIHIRPVAGLPLLHVDEPEFTGGRRLLKGTFDRLAALVGLLLLLPLLLAVAVAVRLGSPGPAFFLQTRVSTHGQTFKMIKFRSMYVDAEERLAALRDQNERAEGLLFKMRNDPRVTRAGGWMRKYSIDELPQLINVVKGDMSLVGPRPPLPREVAQYASDVRRRLLVKPGLTGLWQVSGRSDLSWDESVALDLHYVENWSLALDLEILWRTAAAVLRKEGAY